MAKDNPVMQRRHYEMIARAMKEARNHALRINEETDRMTAFRVGHGGAVAEVARVLSIDNPRFDRARFLEACGVSET